MQPLVFWSRAGAFGAGAILELCAQLLWCELYVMKDLPKKYKNINNPGKYTCLAPAVLAAPSRRWLNPRCE